MYTQKNSRPLKNDVAVKNPLGVIHNLMNLQDSGLRRNDTKTEKQTFYELVKK